MSDEVKSQVMNSHFRFGEREQHEEGQQQQWEAAAQPWEWDELRNQNLHRLQGAQVPVGVKNIQSPGIGIRRFAVLHRKSW